MSIGADSNGLTDPMRRSRRDSQARFDRYGPISLFAIALACGEYRTSLENKAKVDTLPSGAILVVNLRDGVWGERPAWRLTEEVRIGSRDGDSPAAFGDVVSVALDAQGRVYVLDRLAQEVRLFTPSGSYLRTIGGPGGGPGEFRGAAGIRIDPSGRLWVMNQGNLRYSLFDTSGNLLDELHRPATVGWGEWTEAAFSPAGDLYEAFRLLPTVGFVWGRYDTLLFQFVDTVRAPPFPEGTEFPWGRRTATGHGWWMGVASEYRLSQVTWEGDTVRIAERPFKPVALSAEQRNSAKKLAREMRRLTRGQVSSDVDDRQRLFDLLVVDDQGYLWVRLVPDEDVRDTAFDVFDPEGIYLGGISVPYRVEPYSPVPVIRGDRMAFVTKDELDVEYVVLFRIGGRD